MVYPNCTVTLTYYFCWSNTINVKKYKRERDQKGAKLDNGKKIWNYNANDIDT